MKALLLDASPVGDDLTARAADVLEAELRSRGVEPTRLLLRDLSIRPCTGCFGCWIQRPGECVIDDDARQIAAQAIASDVLAIVSPTRFGTWGSLAKSALDRMICLILPHFTTINGELHHQRRYARYPRYIALGTTPHSEPEAAALFEKLAERNAINLHNPSHAAHVIAGDSGADELALVVARLLEEAEVSA